MVKLTQKQNIILRHLDGMSNRGIANEMHVSKDTVNKYVNEYENQKSQILSEDPQADPKELIRNIVEKPRYNSKNRNRTKVTAEMMEEIKSCLKINDQRRSSGMTKQQMKKIDIYEYLHKKGYEISYATVKILIHEIEERHHEAFIRQEYEFGEVCEFDWGTVKLNIGDSGYLPYQMAVFSPAKSGYRYAVLFKAQDTAAFQQSHAEFFDHCKGNYKMMVYDNMRVAVKKFVGLHEKEPTKALTEMSIYYGFNFRFANIARGNEKGHVERSVEYVRRKVFCEPGKDVFETLSAANEFLLKECMRLNCTVLSNDMVPMEMFEEERKYLQPRLPKFESCIYSENRADKYSTILVCQNHYSVPDTLVGKIVSVKTYTDKIIAYHENSIVSVHNRSFKAHDWVIEINHYLKTLKKKPGALHKSTALLQADTQIKYIYDHYYSRDAKTFLQVLEIIYEKGTNAVFEAIKDLEMISPTDLSADKVRVICDHRQEKNMIKVSSHTDYLTEKSRSTLAAYDRLAALQSGKTTVEGV